MNKDDVIKFIDGKVFYYSDYINFLYKQLELKDNIIKEVREYIEKTYEDYKNEDGSLPLTLHDQELLEILDKVGDNNE